VHFVVLSLANCLSTVQGMRNIKCESILVQDVQIQYMTGSSLSGNPII
jgi:hypothetical protein